MLLTYTAKQERKVKMKKSKVEKYWENEDGEVVTFGNCFMRCFEKAGKLQFGSIRKNKNDETSYYVKFTLDRHDLINSDEGAEYLLQTIEDWKNSEDD